ncbi:hypothetical protein NDU88_004124 [Pleurodeles waltl]|uniref:Uncharacterized protein n=1 Tax=Pleurodeles waltl TaxID=8319 RepID=A0AAV7MUA1_PLEWA|nr:hypothetical protein NDU88_004124 [Pleurodeles waltl]
MKRVMGQGDLDQELREKGGRGDKKQRENGSKIEIGDWVKVKPGRISGRLTKFRGPYKVKEVQESFIVLENGEKWNMCRVALYERGNAGNVVRGDDAGRLKCSGFMLMDDGELLCREEKERSTWSGTEERSKRIRSVRQRAPPKHHGVFCYPPVLAQGYGYMDLEESPHLLLRSTGTLCPREPYALLGASLISRALKSAPRCPAAFPHLLLRSTGTLSQGTLCLAGGWSHLAGAQKRATVPRSVPVYTSQRPTGGRAGQPLMVMR